MNKEKQIPKRMKLKKMNEVTMTKLFFYFWNSPTKMLNQKSVKIKKN